MPSGSHARAKVPGAFEQRRSVFEQRGIAGAKAGGQPGAVKMRDKRKGDGVVEGHGTPRAFTGAPDLVS